MLLQEGIKRLRSTDGTSQAKAGGEKHRGGEG
jgi:hypothetical protein